MLARNLCIALNIVVGLMLLLLLFYQLLDNSMKASFRFDSDIDHDEVIRSYLIFIATLLMLLAPVASLMALRQPSRLWAKIVATALNAALLAIATSGLAVMLFDVWIRPWTNPTQASFPVLSLVIYTTFMATSAGSMVQVWKQPPPSNTRTRSPAHEPSTSA